ncbi:MAG: hypothetical protein RR922_01940 [Clostridia bacterium]
MKLIIEMFIYIFFSYGVLSFIWYCTRNSFRMKIKEIHKKSNSNESVEVIVIFENMKKYKDIIEKQLIQGDFDNIFELVDNFECIEIEGVAVKTN